MEFYCFLITMGALLAAVFVGLGVCLGGYMADDRKADTKKSLCGCDHSSVLPGRDTDVRDRNMGNLHGKESGRYRLGSGREITGEEMILVLEYYRLGATLYERTVIDAIVEKIEDEIEC